jgi:hypothetical protein
VIGLGLPAGFAGLACFRDAGRSGAFLATFFRIVLTLLTVFVRVPLLTGIFLRVTLALPFAFFLVAIAASLTPTASRLWIAPTIPPKRSKKKRRRRSGIVAGRERNGPWTRGLPSRSVFKSKNSSWTLPKKHRSGRGLRLVYTMADGGLGEIYV